MVTTLSFRRDSLLVVLKHYQSAGGDADFGVHSAGSGNLSGLSKVPADFLERGVSEWQTFVNYLYSFKGKKVTKTVDQHTDFDKDGVPLPKRVTKAVEVEINIPIIDVLSEFLSSASAVLSWPVFAFLATIYLVYTLATADCERGFSAFGQIKTALRNALTCKRLQQVMTIAMNGVDPAEFDFREAVKLWYVRNPRNLSIPGADTPARRQKLKDLQEIMGMWGNVLPEETAANEKVLHASDDVSRVQDRIVSGGRAAPEARLTAPRSASLRTRAQREQAQLEALMADPHPDDSITAPDDLALILAPRNRLPSGFWKGSSSS